MRDPYAVLGVARDADQETIRKAFKKLARKYHPDVNKDAKAEDRFKEVNAAYEAVGDESKRRLWDEFGEASTRPGFDADAARAWQRGGGRGGGINMDFSGGFPGGVDMEDLLGSLFGSGTSAQRERRGQDQATRVQVDFMTTVLGGEISLQLRRPDGSSEVLKVPIPPGAKDGGRVRLRGKGAPPRGGGACGDLLVELDVPAHPLLRRIDDDLEIDVPITVLEAMAGATITVPTPTGDVKVTVPKGAENGTRLRIKDRGIQKSGRPGHLFLVLRPTVPTEPTEAQLEAARAIEGGYRSPVREKLVL